MSTVVDVDHVRTYLGTKPEKDPQLESALNAERANQARVCVVAVDDKGGIDDDLAEALCRRVARNLAMRGVPLAVQVGELGPVRLASTDPEVRRLEYPFLISERPAIG